MYAAFGGCPPPPPPRIKVTWYLQLALTVIKVAWYLQLVLTVPTSAYVIIITVSASCRYQATLMLGGPEQRPISA